MRVRRAGLAVLATSWLAMAAACANPFGREYEYEEQFYLSVDGSASITINASIPALVALHALALDPSPRSYLDRETVRRLYEAAGCQVTRVGQPWYRHGRRFIQIQLATSDVRKLGLCGPLAWATYTFDQSAGHIRYHEVVGPAAGGDPGAVNWDGQELVAFKLHLPSRITFHNVRRLDDGGPGDVERGNILTWEQRLADRRAGKPVDVEVQMEEQSILYRTLWLFGGSFLAAVGVMAGLIWWTVRKGRARIRN